MSASPWQKPSVRAEDSEPRPVGLYVLRPSQRGALGWALELHLAFLTLKQLWWCVPASLPLRGCLCLAAWSRRLCYSLDEYYNAALGYFKNARHHTFFSSINNQHKYRGISVSLLSPSRL